MVEMVTLRVIAHRSVREHSLMRVSIDRALLDNPLWFDEDGEPTKRLYDWAVRQGSTLECDYTDFEDDEDLVVEHQVVPNVPTLLGAVIVGRNPKYHFIRVATVESNDPSPWYCIADEKRWDDQSVFEVLVQGGTILSEGLAPIQQVSETHDTATNTTTNTTTNKE